MFYVDYGDSEYVAVEELCELRADLRRTGQLIGPNDTMIAATALVHKLTLVTHNTRQFNRVPGLRIEDWEG